MPIFTDKFVSVEHLVADLANSNQEGYVADLGLAAMPVNIQPASPEVTALNGGAYGQTFTMFTTVSGILMTDRLTTVSGTYTKQYIVKGKQNFDYWNGQHLEFVLEEIQ